MFDWVFELMPLFVLRLFAHEAPVVKYDDKMFHVVRPGVLVEATKPVDNGMRYA